MNIDIKMNSVYIPYMNEESETQIYFGGSSSGKSYWAAQRIVIDVMNGVNWMCCRNVAKTIRRSIFNEITKAILTIGVGRFFSINKTDMVITCLLNDKQIIFCGLDDPEKVKSVTPINGVLERILIEEATEVKKSAYKQLKKRLRGISDKKKFIMMLFNPILKSHWIYEEFFGQWNDESTVLRADRLLILKTTYKDNGFLTKDDIESLENESDPYFYNVYTLGNWGVLGHVIFQNWHTADLSEMRKSFDNIYNGLDFGYASDPNALIRFHHDKKHKRIYIFDELYKCGMSDGELTEAAKRMVGRGIVTCDNAEPKTIDFLAANGVYAVPAVKGADSVNRGIRFLQGYEIIIDMHCQNCKNEFEQYHWEEDKYGNPMSRPVDRNNHLIDALRYASEPLQLGGEVTLLKTKG